LIGTDAKGDNLGNAVGISISAAGNTIGQAGAGDTVADNTQRGVAVLSGSGNVITQDQYVGSNGPATPAPANDIVIAAGANGNQPAPNLLGASFDANTNQLVLQAWESSATAPPQQTLEVYLDTPSRRTFKISTPVTLSNNPNAPTTVSVTVPGLTSGALIIATLTDPTNGTSTFSTAVTIAGGNVVTNTNDSGPGSLRSAIGYAIANPSTTIVFDIAGTGPFIINVSSALPGIPAHTTIDGTTESASLGRSAVVEIDGQGSTGDGLTLVGAKITITGLEVIDFKDGAGIRIESTGDTITDDLIGTDGNPANQGLGNQVGIFVDGANGGGAATIGGTAAAAANTIGFNSAAGISIGGSAALIIGNEIGTDSAGDDLGNAVGVSISSPGNTVGGAAAANTIGFNDTAGISIGGGATTNLVIGNDIGAGASGTPMPNGTGILLDSSNNTIGGMDVLASDGSLQSQPGNVIGFNSQFGIQVLADDNTIEGNFVGTSPAGLNLGTGPHSQPVGIEVGGSSNTIGGTNATTATSPPGNDQDGNLVGFNTSAGISITGSASKNVVIGNDIGADPARPGTPLGNGIGVSVAAAGNTVGGTATGSANIIGENTTGVQLGASDVLVLGNWIGTDDNSDKLGNVRAGILILDASDDTIGGTIAAAANTIGFATEGAGISITGAAATGNIVQGNDIGTDAKGDKLGNKGDGIDVSGSSNIIGGTIDGTTGTGANTIGFNSGNGIAILAQPSVSGSVSAGVTATGNVVGGNFIGSNGSFANLGNGGDGILIEATDANSTATNVDAAAMNNTIGGAATLDQNSLSGPVNIIGFNGGAGVDIRVVEKAGSGNTLAASNNVVEGNLIGGFGAVSGAGSAGIPVPTSLPNGGPGVSLTAQGTNVSLSGNTIGGPAVTAGGTTAGGGVSSLGAAANYIWNNAGAGIDIDLSAVAANSAVASTIEGNLISRNRSDGVDLIGDMTGDISLGQIIDNFVGTDPTGTTTFQSGLSIQSFGNALSGILLEATGGPNPTGAATAVIVAGNVISGNGLSGVTVQNAAGTTSSPAAARVDIQDNRLGTDKDGARVGIGGTGATLSFGNVLDGIRLDDVSYVVVGSSSTTGNAVGLDLSASGGNLISANLGRGIEMVDGAQHDLVAGNLIGVVLGTGATGQATLLAVDPSGIDTGNLSDGIFVVGSPGNSIQGNVISANRGYGIHANGGSDPDLELAISGNFIGTDQAGTSIRDANGDAFGNGSDGVFLDSASGVTIGGTAGVGVGPGAGNIISGNHANGIDLLSSSGVCVEGNFIGTDAHQMSQIGNPADDFGNASNGVFINLSNDITVGGTAPGAGNTVSGNHNTGIYVSGASNNSTTGVSDPGNGNLTADGNFIEGNHIGVGLGAGGRAQAIPNAVAGVILSNADDNRVGDTVAGAGNVISGNGLDGILLVNFAEGNTIASNLIGTDPTGSFALPNSADGVFLLAVTQLPNGTTISGTISQNVVSGNTISGNNANGIELFGTNATYNQIEGNRIGLGASSAAIPNLANGVSLNNAGMGNTIGGNTTIAGTGTGNIISGNGQAGILIASTQNVPTGALVEGNLIGTDAASDAGIGNRSYGVEIYGSSSNTIGGPTTAPGSGAGNVISGNNAAGIQISSPSLSAPAHNNVVAGNLIGTGTDGRLLPGPPGSGNGSDGVQVIDGQSNLIGGPSYTVGSATYSGRNVISGNANNGVFIEQVPGSNVPSSNNQVMGNWIGTDSSGTSAVPNLGSGIEVLDGTGNLVGAAAGAANLGGMDFPAAGVAYPGNVVSGNAQWGVQIELSGASAGQTQTTVLGDVIGMNAAATGALGNGQGGILVDNLSNALIGQSIGGTVAGWGNLISGNANVGIQLIGPQVAASGQNNLVEGNVIGLDANGRVVALGGGVFGNGTGILINNSPGNVIGGTSPAARNVISGNSQAGIHLFQNLSTRDTIEGNFIGTDPTGRAFPGGSSEIAPRQTVGVLVDGSSNDVVGGTTPGADNVISGNAVGVEITGLKQNNGQVSGSGNVVEGNLIGTDASGKLPVSNLDLGVFINNCQGNTIGPGNDIAANGIAGVEILGDGSTANLVAGNTIGLGKNGAVFSSRGSMILHSISPQAGIPVYSDAQLNGVVILGASQNIVGLEKGLGHSAANTIGGNVQVGVYITSRDYFAAQYSVPVGNAVSGNVIRSNGIYGVLLYDAPNNSVPPFNSRSRALIKNRFGHEKMGFRNYQGSLDAGTSLPTTSGRSPGGAARGKAVVRRARATVHHARAVGHRDAAAGHHGKPAITPGPATAEHLHQGLASPSAQRRAAST
jgi:parallel beta-helix repeat protein